MKIRAVIALFLIVDIAIAAGYFLLPPGAFANPGFEKKAAIETPRRMGALAAAPNTLTEWPPTLGAQFPKVALTDHDGRPFTFESLRGRPVLVEFVAMTCAACQAWSGAHNYGVYEGLAAQAGLKSIEDYYRQFTNGLDLFDGKIAFVQLVVYDTALAAPSRESLTAWRKHFHFDQHRSVFVVTGGEPLCNSESFKRTPGFALLDREGVVRFEALGHTPRHNLYTELLAGVRPLL